MASVIDIHGLAPLQEGMLFHTLYGPESGVYVEQRWCVILGDLNIKVFQDAWNQAILRHTALRAEFHWQETEKPVQVIYDEVTPEWILESDVSFEQYIETDRQRGFKLDRVPLMRFALFPMENGQHRFLWTFHHILLDGWSSGLLIREVLSHYQTLLSGKALSLHQALPFGGYIGWLNERDADQEETYWRKTLEGFETPTFLAYPVDTQKSFEPVTDCPDRFRERELESGYIEICFNLDQEETRKLTQFSQKNRLTLNTLMQGAWALLLHGHTNQKDILFGAVVSGRPPELEGMESVVGLCINTVPVRVQIDSGSALLPWLEQLQSDQRQREKYGFARLMDLQTYTEVPRGEALFETLMVFENYPISMEEALDSNALELQLVDREGYERTNYPLTLMILPGASVDLQFRFDISSFSRSAIKRIAEQMRHVLLQFISHENRILGECSITPQQESRCIADLCCGPTEEHDFVPVQQRVSRVARASEAKTAVIHEALDSEKYIPMTYGLLDELSDRLAAHLQKVYRVGRGGRVGVFLERTSMLPVSLLGILKCGATYVPLDRSFPAQRLRYMAEDAELNLLLWDGEHLDIHKIFGEQFPKESLLEIDQSKVQMYQEPFDPVEVQTTDLAYIIYTSGSTGKPKGVAIHHGNVSNFLLAMEQTPGLQATDVMLAVTTISFDIAVLELFLPLVCGAQVVLARSDSGRSGEQLLRLMQIHQVTIMQATPVTWRLLIESNGDVVTAFRSLKILCGGEALDVSLGNRLLELGAEVWNLYGPTETTVWSGALRLNASLLADGKVPIGAPILNTQFLIRDEFGRAVPLAGRGELLIGGEGVSPGYWKRASLTEERFVGGYYVTGDEVRLREDGLLEFIGRLDGQIKIRGFRIELGEIESVLNEHATISQSVVLNRSESSDASLLIAFVRLSEKVPGDHDTVEQSIREHLQSRLPGYMHPNHFEILDAFPLTLNGKIDRSALRSLEVSVVIPKDGNRPIYPTPKHEMIAGIWADVLHCQRVGMDDHFFDMGGHSLAAARVIGRMRDVMQTSVALQTLFEHPIFHDFVEAITDDTLKGHEPIPKLEINPDRLPLSAAQRRQWLMAELFQESVLYAIPTAVRLRGELDPARLQSSLETVVARHMVLHMSFHEEDGEPFGILHEDCPVFLSTTDFSHLSPEGAEIHLKEAMLTLARTGFDLEKPPLWRAKLFRLSPEEHVFCFNLHHILADGWSLGILVKDLTLAYGAAMDASESFSTPNPSEVNYLDYIAWWNQQDSGREVAYWKSALAGVDPLLEFPTDFLRPAEQQFEGEKLSFTLDSPDTEALRSVARQQDVTMFMTLLTAFYVLLYRYTGCCDLAIGSPVANRPRSEFEGILGLFANTVVLRTDLSGNPTLATILARVRNRSLEAYEHQKAPFEDVLESLQIPRSRAHSPLFQILFTLQNAPLEVVEIDGLEWSPIPVDVGISKFDLSLAMRETSEGLEGSFEFRKDLFQRSTIERLVDHFKRLVKIFPDAMDLPLSSVTPVDDVEKETLLRMGKPPAFHDEIEVSTIHERFSSQVSKTPDAIAILQGSVEVSFREVEELTERLAEQLRELGVGHESPVGIATYCNPVTILAIIAILKAGGGYVPLDSRLPKARLHWQLRDAGIGIVLSANPEFFESLSDETSRDIHPLDCAPYCLTGWRIKSLSKVSHGQPGADSLAYIMYTSGSTGIPKGVCTPHRGVMRLVCGNRFMSFSQHDVYLQAAPLGFDASTLEVWGPLLNGGRLVLPSSDKPSLEEIGRLVELHGVTTLWLTAGLFHLMVDEGASPLKGVKQLLAGGDVLSLPHLKQFHQLSPKATLINGYGPTEGTTFTCCHTFTQQELCGDSQSNVPIGKPISGTSCYILDEDMQLVPVGVPGELYLGGLGIARGYLDRPRLTAEKFIPNPFFDAMSEPFNDAFMTLYRSGDRVRWKENGTVEFLGRIDDQVKIRGFRVEPGEIVSTLSLHPEIKNAFVRVMGEGADDKRLVAYVESNSILDEGTSGWQESLRHFLAERLPPSMIPTRFVCLETLPLNSNGKVNVSALPDPECLNESSADDREMTEVERRIHQVWESVLPVKSIKLSDNFFDLGGDSIMALRIISRLKRMGLDATPAQVFQHQTIQSLASVVTPRSSLLSVALTQPTNESFNPIPVQSWFLQLALNCPHHFNQAACIKVMRKIEPALLDEALKAVYDHHDGLRLRLRGGRLHYVEVEAPTVEWGNESDMESYAEAIQTGLNFEHGPVFRVAGFRSDKEDSVKLLFVAHHMVVDALSWRILLEDIWEAYSQASNSRPILLPPKSASFQAWANALGQKVADANQDLDYWESLATIPDPLMSATRSKMNTDGDSNTPSRKSFSLDEQTTTQLFRHKSHTNESRMLPVLLVALARSLHRGFSKETFVVDLESHGRDASPLGVDLDVSRTVGWFTSIYPVRLEWLSDMDWDQQIQNMVSILDKIPNHGLSYGLLRFGKDKPAVIVPSWLSFNFLGQLDSQDPSPLLNRIAPPGRLIAEENAPSHPLGVNCWVSNGRFEGEWIYDSQYLTSSESHKLMEGFINALTDSVHQTEDASDQGETLGGLDKDLLAKIASQVRFDGKQDG